MDSKPSIDNLFGPKTFHIKASQFKWHPVVMRPFCLVESHSQDAAVNVGVLSVYLTTILCIHRQSPIFSSVIIPLVGPPFTGYPFTDPLAVKLLDNTLIHYCVSFIGILATTNLYYCHLNIGH